MKARPTLEKLSRDVLAQIRKIENVLNVHARDRAKLEALLNGVDAKRRRAHSRPMNTKLLLSAVLAASLLVGCQPPGGGTNPFTTPAALTGDVSDTVRLGLEVYPQAAGEVAIARDVICSDAGQTNVAPGAIVADLAKSGITNQTSKIIVDGVILVWNRVYPFLNSTNIQPYSEALCLGLQEGTATGATARKTLRPLPPHLK